MHPAQTSLAQTSLKDLQLGEATLNGRGGKNASLSIKGQPLKITLRNATTPFQVSSFDHSSDRKSLDVRADAETTGFLERLDKELKSRAANLGCAEAGYTSLLKPQKEGFAPLFRQKITISPAGKSPCKFFDAESRRRLTEEEVAELPWRDLEMDLLVKISSLWVNSGRWGATATPAAIMVRRNDICPFAEEL